MSRHTSSKRVLQEKGRLVTRAHCLFQRELPNALFGRIYPGFASAGAGKPWHDPCLFLRLAMPTNLPLLRTALQRRRFPALQEELGPRAQLTPVQQSRTSLQQTTATNPSETTRGQGVSRTVLSRSGERRPVDAAAVRLGALVPHGGLHPQLLQRPSPFVVHASACRGLHWQPRTAGLWRSLRNATNDSPALRDCTTNR
jgi:hypothetical protein